jgi:hypothetical protein
MNHRWLLRIGAVAAITGALAQAAATVLEPQWSGDPGEAIRTIAGSGSWTLDRLLDLVGLLLVVGALAVVGRTLAGGAGQGLGARMGQPLLAVLGALGASAVLTGATLKETAEAWATAGPAAKPAYLAVFAAASQTTDALFFGAFLALGVYLAALGAAILTGGGYARWVGWACAASAVLVLVLVGDLLMLAAEAAFLAVLLGFLLFMVVLVALGVTMWQQAALSTAAAEQGAAAGGGSFPWVG